MPDNSNTSELFARIREQLAAIGKPGGVPLHPQIKDILQVIADFLQTVEVINTDNEQQDEEQNQAIAALQALIADLKLSLQQNTAADEADRARLTADEAALTALEEQVNAWETEINNRINAAIQPVVSGLDDAKQQLLADQARITQIEADLSALLSQIGVLPPGTTVAETLNQISVAIEGLKSGVAALQEQDRIDDDRIKSILDQIAALDQKIKDLPPAGLSETEVQTLVDGMLQTLRDSITALQQQDTTDDGRIKSILDQIAALEEKINNLPTGGGLSEAAVKALIEAALQTLGDSITALQQQDTTDDGRIKSILAQIAALEEKINNLPTGGGLSEAAVKALIEAALQTLRDSITALQQQDTTDDGRIKSILDQIAALEEKINNLPTGGGLSEAAVKALIEAALQTLRDSITALQQQDNTDDGRIKAILDQIAALDQKIRDLPPAGLSEAEVQILVDGMLQILRDNIAALQQQDTTDDGRIKSILDQIALLDQKIKDLPPAGLSETEVQTLVDGMLQTLRDNIAALQQQDIADDGRINDALAQITALQTKVDANFNLTAADIQLIRDELLQIGQDLTLLKNQGSDHETRLQQIEAIKAALDQLLQNPPLTVEQIQALVQAALATILTDIAQLKQQDISDNGRFLKIEADITLILEKLKDLPPGGGGSGISAQEMRDYVQLILEPIRTELGELRSFRDSTILALTALQQDVAALKLALTQQPPQTWVEEAVKAALAAALAQLMPLITALQTENITQQGLVEGLRSELNALKLTVENWPPGPTEEQVRRWITTILEIFKASLDTKFTGLTTDITNLQNQITVLQTDIKNVPTAEQIKVLVLAALEAWKGEIELKIGNLQQQYLLLVEEDKTLHLAINNLKIEIEGRLSGIQTELTEVKSSIGGLKTWQTEVQGKLPDLEKCCTDGNASIEGLKTWQTEVQGKLPNLEKCCTDGNASIEGLKTWQTEVQGKLPDLEKCCTDGNASIEGLKTWQTEVQGKLPDLEKCCTDGNASIEGLKTWQTEVQGKLPDLEKCCTDGKTSIHTLEEDVENIKKELEHSDSSSVGIRLAPALLAGARYRGRTGSDKPGKRSHPCFCGRRHNPPRRFTP
jgi:chromosome segregation ATPase